MFFANLVLTNIFDILCESFGPPLLNGNILLVINIFVSIVNCGRRIHVFFCSVCRNTVQMHIPNSMKWDTSIEISDIPITLAC